MGAADAGLLDQIRRTERAVALIELGARMQLLEAETGLARAPLVRLYKEVRNEAPPKGLLPFSVDWFLGWRPNIHASLFYNAYARLVQAEVERVEALLTAYRFYVEQAVQCAEPAPVLAVTRAWMLTRFVAQGQLAFTACTRCGGHFVVSAETGRLGAHVCGLCRPPARAGKPLRREPDACV